MDYISRLRHREKTYRDRIVANTANIEHMNSLIKRRNEEIFAAEWHVSAQELEEWKKNSAAIRREIERLTQEKAEMEKDLGEMQREIAEIEAGN